MKSRYAEKHTDTQNTNLRKHTYRSAVAYMLYRVVSMNFWRVCIFVYVFASLRTLHVNWLDLYILAGYFTDLPKIHAYPNICT